ncbi:MAG: Gfo/Idh/MocA family oxidoreductase, partial [Lewinella sp.]
MKSIRFAVVGYGHIGRRHAALIAAHPEAELVAVCDLLSMDELTPLADSGMQVPLHKDLDTLLDTAFDVACICTPNGLHARQAIRCLAAGRHVVIEKPIALTVRECDELIAASKKYNKE